MDAFHWQFFFFFSLLIGSFETFFMLLSVKTSLCFRKKFIFFSNTYSLCDLVVKVSAYGAGGRRLVLMWPVDEPPAS